MALTSPFQPPGSQESLPGAPLLDLYAPGQLFTWSELQAMASDGILQQVYQRGYAPPGAVTTPQLRARSAALGVPPAIRQRVVAGRLTAAWIHGCFPEPDRLALLVDAKRRVSSLRSTRGCTLHEVRLGPCDVVSIGGLLVSSPLRTALDIALHVEAGRAVPALRGLLARPEQDVRLRLLTLAIEATPRLPHKRAALEKLALLAAPLVAGGPVDIKDTVDPADRAEHVVEVLGVPHLEGELGDGKPVC